MILGFMSVCMIIYPYAFCMIFGFRLNHVQKDTETLCEEKCYLCYFREYVFDHAFVFTELQQFCIAGIFIKSRFASTCSRQTFYWYRLNSVFSSENLFNFCFFEAWLFFVVKFLFCFFAAIFARPFSVKKNLILKELAL